MKKFLVAAVVFGATSGLLADYPIRSAAMTKTRVTRGFWFDRLETNRTATLKSNWAKCNETPRIADNGGRAYDATLPADATFEDDTIEIGDKTFPALRASNGLKLIPYCLWDNRDPGNEMQTWFR